MDMSITGLPNQPTSPASSPPASMRAGKRVADIAIDEAGEWAKKPGHVVWIGLLEPSQALLQRVQAQFDLHPLAIEDAGQGPSAAQDRAIWRCPVHRRAHRPDDRRPHRLRRDAPVRRRGYVVSVRHGASTSYAAVRERLRILSRGRWRTARTTSSMPSSTSSSTTTCRCSRRSRTRSRSIEDSVLA